MTRRSVAVLGALCMVATAVVAAYAAGQVKAAKVLTADTVRAKRVEVVDAAGKVRIELDASGNSPVLSIKDRQGRDSARLFVGASGPALSLLNESGGGSIVLAVGSLGDVFGTRLVLSQGASARADLRLSEDGAALFELLDKAEDHPPHAERRAILAVGPDGSPSLTLRDSDGGARAVVGSTALEGTRTEATSRTDESSIVLLDREGKVLWRAP